MAGAREVARAATPQGAGPSCGRSTAGTRRNAGYATPVPHQVNCLTSGDTWRNGSEGPLFELAHGAALHPCPGRRAAINRS